MLITITLSICDFTNIPVFSHRDRRNGNAMNTDIMTIKEVAVYLKLTEKTAYRLTAQGKIPGFKVGGSWRFKMTDIEKWIEGQKGIRGAC